MPALTKRKMLTPSDGMPGREGLVGSSHSSHGPSHPSHSAGACRRCLPVNVKVVLAFLGALTARRTLRLRCTLPAIVDAGAGSPSTLVVAVPNKFAGFNEVYRNYTGGGGYYVANNIFNRLVIVDVYGDGTIRPDLADRWEVLDGGRTYRFHLREAHWHDGKPLCADDVRETYLTAIREGYRAAASLTDVQDIIVRGDRTVDIRLHEPNAGFLAQLGIFVWTHILPAHIYAGTDWTTNPANDQPVGTGPYRFTEWQDNTVRLAANPSYHNGRPRVDAIEFRVVPDVHDALDLLKRGEVDFCTQDVPCEQLAQVAQIDGVEINRIRGNALGHVTFNFNREPWSDRLVRLAVAKLVDRDALANMVCQRASPAPFAYLEHVGWAFNSDARYPNHDSAGAVALLNEAGLQPDAHGVRLRGRLVCRDLSEYWQTTTRYLATVLQAVGIHVAVDILDPIAWNQQVATDRDFDLLVDGLGIGPDPVLFEEVLATSSVLNVGGYENSELDSLFKRGKAEGDRRRRAAHYQKAQSLIAHDLPRIHLLLHGHHHAYRDRWKGWSWDIPVQGSLPAWSLEQVGPAAGAEGQQGPS